MVAAVAALLAGVLSVHVASCDSITYSDSYGPDKAGWTGSLSFPEFNPSYGTLTAIVFEMTGTVQGWEQVENLGPIGAYITADLTATIDLSRPNGTLIVETIPLNEQVFYTYAWDDPTYNYVGTDSGSAFGLSAEDVESATLSSLGDLNLFTGTGSIDLPVASSGQSTASGPGNMQSQFATLAGADVTVTYEYDAAPTPEFCSAALVGLSVLPAAGLVRRRRRRF
jgi:hypothetical protein